MGLGATTTVLVAGREQSAVSDKDGEEGDAWVPGIGVLPLISTYCWARMVSERVEDGK